MWDKGLQMFSPTVLHHVLTALLTSASHSSDTAHVAGHVMSCVIGRSCFIKMGLAFKVNQKCLLSFTFVSNALAQAQTWCCWIASLQTAPPIYSTTATTCLGRGGAQSPLKIRWNIPKVCAISCLHNGMSSFHLGVGKPLLNLAPQRNAFVTFT